MLELRLERSDRGAVVVVGDAVSAADVVDSDEV